MSTRAYTEAVERLEKYRANEGILTELNSTLHNSGEKETDYAGWLEGCGVFLADNNEILKEWM